MTLNHILTPDWDAPPNVRALMTTRLTQVNGHSGVSVAPFAAFNVATHVGDEPDAVAHNRALLRQALPSEPLWLNQVHGVNIYTDAVDCNGIPEADAVLVTEPRQVGVIMTADCLPVLFTTRAGDMVAGAHAGWRSLVDGVLERTVAAMVNAGAARGDIVAWLGAAIGKEQFEVGAEVRAQFIDKAAVIGIVADATVACFTPCPASRHRVATEMGDMNKNGNSGNSSNAGNKYLADIYALARQRLQCAGLSETQIFGGGLCTVSDPARFYSYRRDGACGRMASLVWFE